MADLVEVYSTPHTAEARLVAAALTTAGLAPTVLSDGLANTLGAGQLAIPCRVMVPDTEAEEARLALQLMEEAANAPASADTPEHCPDCGAPWEAGFEVCWKCDEGHGGASEPPETVAAAEDAPRLRVGMDSVRGRLLRSPRAKELVLLAAAPFPLAAWGLGPALGAIGTVASAGLFLGAVIGYRRTTRIRVDAHALRIGDQRMLWEELRGVSVSTTRIGWEYADGTVDHVDVRLGEPDREVLQEAMQRQVERPREPRNHEGEAAVRTLVDR